MRATARPKSDMATTRPSGSAQWIAGVRGTYSARDLGELEFWRETITTGRALAAIPRSANQISPGWRLIEQQVEDLLFGDDRARDIKKILMGPLHHFHDARPDFLRQGVHEGLLPLVPF